MIPAPRIGNVVNRRTETMKIAQATKSHVSEGTPEFLLNCSVAKKVIAPASDDAPSEETEWQGILNLTN